MLDQNHKNKLILINILQELERAEIILTKTYPLVKEQKLFLEVFKILVNYYEKIINLLENSTNQKKLLNHINSEKKQLENIIEAQKTGPADFPRKGDYIICENNYKVRVISESSALNFLTNAKEVGKIITKSRI